MDSRYHVVGPTQGLYRVRNRLTNRFLVVTVDKTFAHEMAALMNRRTDEDRKIVRMNPE